MPQPRKSIIANKLAVGASPQKREWPPPLPSQPIHPGPPATQKKDKYKYTTDAFQTKKREFFPPGADPRHFVIVQPVKTVKKWKWELGCPPPPPSTPFWTKFPHFPVFLFGKRP